MASKPVRCPKCGAENVVDLGLLACGYQLVGCSSCGEESVLDDEDDTGVTPVEANKSLTVADLRAFCQRQAEVCQEDWVSLDRRSGRSGWEAERMAELAACRAAYLELVEIIDRGKLPD
ncbi:hypothetical protein [Nitrolancea hollandica]|uniref:hypothetical protein n=1 Tax=Nitrolancea hollandica TaxID=1206749 RepID=UPI0002E00F86|nr:hypothetical protein [Nitrolancea hollandica]